MPYSSQRVNYDLIAHLYDEPGRDYETDPNLIEFLNMRAGIQSTHIRILDLGCGTGKQLTANHDRFPEVEMVGLDLFQGMLDQAHNRCKAITWIRGDSSSPPFASNSFDYITNQFSYHHVQDKNGMIKAVFRILKPGGRFVITNLDPWSMPGWIVYTWFPQSRQRDLSDFLPVDELTDLMQKTGFSNVHLRCQHRRTNESLGDFFKYASQRHRTSQLIAIQDDAYEAGITELKGSITQLGTHAPVASEICLVWITGDKPG